jgi:uncharacterized membrane protein
MAAPVAEVPSPPRRPSAAHRGQRRFGSLNVAKPERWLSVVGGAALAAYAARRRGIPGALMAVAGSEMLFRGATGHCHVYQALGVSTARETNGHAQALEGSATEIHRSVTINRPRGELYRFFRDFQNLPQFMEHLERVTVLDDRRSHWVVKAPAGKTVEWDAEITEERENELISWRAGAHADVPNDGTVRFVEAPGGRGTEVHVTATVKPPAGRVGKLVAKLFGEDPDRQIREDLRRFKQVMEAGEVARGGEPAGAGRSTHGAYAEAQS